LNRIFGFDEVCFLYSIYIIVILIKLNKTRKSKLNRTHSFFLFSLFVFQLNMNEIFNIRSFVENQVEKLSSPTNLLVDRLRQTVDTMIYPFTSSNTTEQDSPLFMTANEFSFDIVPSDSASSLSVSSNNSSQNNNTNHTNLSEMNIDNQQISTYRRQSTLRRHVSETSDPNRLRPIYHDHAPVNVHALLTNSQALDRSHSLIRQSTDTTCTFPIRRTLRRMESIEIPGLNGVKAIRYINDNLGKLEPNLYRKPILPNDPTNDFGQITFTLFFNQTVSALIIKIVSLDHLRYRDMQTKIQPNPFVKLTLLPDRRKKFQTKVAKHVQNVQINETFQFQLTYEQLCKRILLLSIYDFRRSSKRNLIGSVKIDDLCIHTEIMSNEMSFTRNIIPGTEVCLLSVDRKQICVCFSI